MGRHSGRDPYHRGLLAQKRRRMQADVVRERLRVDAAVEAVHQTEKDLRRMAVSTETTPAMVNALRAVLDSSWRKIDKLVPALRAVELTGADGGPVQLTTAQQIAQATAELAAINLQRLETVAGEVLYGPDTTDDTLGQSMSGAEADVEGVSGTPADDVADGLARRTDAQTAAQAVKWDSSVASEPGGTPAERPQAAQTGENTPPSPSTAAPLSVPANARRR